VWETIKVIGSLILAIPVALLVIGAVIAVMAIGPILAVLATLGGVLFLIAYGIYESLSGDKKKGS
jgi:hypothetical protein